MINMKYLSFLAASILLISCQQQKKADQTSGATEAPSSYQAPTAPAQYTTPEGKSEYVFEHYWDNYNFQDTSVTLNNDYTEQAVVNYINIFDKVKPEQLNDGIEDLLNQAKAEPKTFNLLQSIFDRYLSDPNSPMRNDAYYEVFLVNLLKSGHLDENQKIKYDSRLKLTLKNKVGTRAADFKFLRQDDQISSLYAEQADYLFLMFYEPGCSSCEDAFAYLKSDDGYNKLIESGKLEILAIYPDGDRDIWEDYKSNIPKNWVNGLDQEQVVVNMGLYQILATPTIYLLDKHKNVLLKDATIPQVSSFLSGITK